MIGALIARHPRLSNWLYGFTPPERGTVVLVHRRVYIVPTRLGWMFGATLAILLIGSINYSLSLGFALTFLLAGTWLVGMIHTARNLGGIGVTPGRSLPVFAGDPARFRLHLDGRSRFDRPAILARHLGSGAQSLVDIPASATLEVVLAIPAPRRGWHPLGRVMLETRFPLGLFRAWSYVEPAARCLVYPKPERSPLPQPMTNGHEGRLRAHIAGSEDFSGLRGYQPADSRRHVAWKALARTGQMLTKQFSGEACAQLWLDWNLLAAALGTERRLSRLAGWVLEAESCGADYGLRLPGGVEIQPARGEEHRAACLRALALYEVSQ
jgi:uncharacterized protein (DUF58 family)